MRRIFAAAACAAMLFGLDSVVAPAATKPVPPTTATTNSITVGLGPEGQRVIVTFQFKTGGTNPLRASYAYNPANGSINELPTPEQSAESTPVKGATVKGGRNPGGSYTAQRVIGDLNGDGTADFAAGLPAGNYDIVVTVPAFVIATKGKGAQSARMTATGAAAARETALPRQPMLLMFRVIIDSAGNMSVNQPTRRSITAVPSIASETFSTTPPRKVGPRVALPLNVTAGHCVEQASYMIKDAASGAILNSGVSDLRTPYMVLSVSGCRAQTNTDFYWSVWQTPANMCYFFPTYGLSARFSVMGSEYLQEAGNTNGVYRVTGYHSLQCGYGYQYSSWPFPTWDGLGLVPGVY